MPSSNPPDQADETNIIRHHAANTVDRIFQQFLEQHTPFGFHPNLADLPYHPLPYRPQPGDALLLPEPWRVRLELLAGRRRMYLGVDLYGDVVLGRGSSRPGRIVLDLEPYGALEHGVSREHLMLRPTPNQLFAIDQGSTNRTTVNGMPSGVGVATTLAGDDLLSLGEMAIALRVITRPADAAPLR